MSIIIFNLVIVGIAVLLCLCICACFGVVYYLRPDLFRSRDAPEGASKDVIDKLEVVIYEEGVLPEGADKRCVYDILT
jgi:hypothetical protein